MAQNRNNTTPASTSSARPERAAPPAGRTADEEDLGFGQAQVYSMGHTEQLDFSVEGEIYDAWMPRIARSADGLVPVLPIRTLEDGAEGLLIVPGAFNSWLRRQRPARGTKLRLRRKGVDERTGAWALAVTRL